MLALLSVWAAASWIWYSNENKEEQDKYCGDRRPKRGGYRFTGRQNIRGAPWTGSSGNSKRNVNVLAASLLQPGAIGAQFSSSRVADWADLWKVVRNPLRGFDSIQRWQTLAGFPPEPFQTGWGIASRCCCRFNTTLFGSPWNTHTLSKYLNSCWTKNISLFFSPHMFFLWHC